MNDIAIDSSGQTGPVHDVDEIPLLDAPDAQPPHRLRSRKANAAWLAFAFLTIALVAGRYSQLFAGMLVGIVCNLLTIVVQDIDLVELTSRLRELARRGSAGETAIAKNPIWRTRQIVAYRVIETMLYLTLTVLGLYGGHHTKNGHYDLPPPPSLITTTIGTYTGHTGFLVYSVVQLTNGNIASASSDGTVKIWNPTDPTTTIATYTGQTDRTGHHGAVISVVQLANGNIASASSDGTVKIWNPTDPTTTIAAYTGHTGFPVYSVVQLTNGNIASASSDGTVKIWNPR